MQWLILPLVALLVLLWIRRGFTVRFTKLVGGAKVQYGSNRGLPAVRVTIAGLSHIETFRIRSDAEDYFCKFGRDDLSDILKR